MTKVTNDDLVLAAKQLDRARRENARVKKLNQGLIVVENKHDDFLEELARVMGKEAKRPVAKFAKPKAINTKHTEVAVKAVSDLHLTEVVNQDECNGINKYNVMIAAKRLWKDVQASEKILKIHGSVYTIEKVVALVLGDMISGTIHPEQITTNELSDPAAVILCARLMAIYFRELSKLGIPIELECIHGNHPRMSAKMPTKKQAHTNLDWLIYEMLKTDLERDGIVVNVHKSQMALKKIYNHTYAFEHGIGVASGKEEDFEDRVRAMFDDPVYRKATGHTGASFDQLVIGNMHKPKFLERTVVNAAYVGQNELGQSWRLKPISPKQLMWGVSKDHPRTWEYMIDVDTISEKADNPISDYAAWFLRNNN